MRNSIKDPPALSTQFEQVVRQVFASDPDVNEKIAELRAFLGACLSLNDTPIGFWRKVGIIDFSKGRR